jgi:hypothetical protein
MDSVSISYYLYVATLFLKKWKNYLHICTSYALVPIALAHITMEAVSLSQIDTDWPANSLEFCPHAGAADIFVCGTYKLEAPTQTQDQSEAPASAKAPQRRKGKCLVFRADEENGTWCVIDKSERQTRIRGSLVVSQQLQEVQMSAVLDLKWYLPHS